ncbi:MAG: tRNA (adenosine(37)-N6)-threonylcarbamoyltransferase complex transferase subunit TsaD, partial [candidate division WOR-3 bacterium]|nr:tRNA (adenosine(37)-N6)-threonylcarbamoyltransferase complex transferase subunit TsaD [candidate division WOR-3 bacterium]
MPSNSLTFLGIETSCDETAAGIVNCQKTNGRLAFQVLSNIVSSQYIHSQVGGVIPEQASRAHIQLIVPIVKTALAVANKNYQDLDGIAVTYAPGLVGSLLVGLSFAKALSFSLSIPFVGVNHLRGHIFSLFLTYPELQPPFLALIISGGHTELLLIKSYHQQKILGTTLDDACGEAFDKVARMLGFSYPGGSFIEKLAQKGKRTISFPVPNIPGYDFSFSGLKTAVLYYLKSQSNSNKEDVACSFQETAFDFLLQKIRRAVSEYQINKVGVSGGVAINKRLREKFNEFGKAHNVNFYFPDWAMCMDNGCLLYTS